VKALLAGRAVFWFTFKHQLPLRHFLRFPRLNFLTQFFASLLSLQKLFPR
jgi:hypothetical protein